mmetsp:Transcript_20002/g.3265  ORF Transcript_20002/g.3265 Transcript_20002/m.3265 type:complete len:130 (+) Transcript_20002:273-662(+)
MRTHGKVLKKEIHFNVLLVGDSALGKTTFIDTLFKVKFGIENTLKSGDYFESHKAKLSDSPLTLYLNLIDSPGYSHNTDIRAFISKIHRFLMNSSLEYKNQKKTLPRRERQDTRVHLCLYFIRGPRCNR